MKHEPAEDDGPGRRVAVDPEFGYPGEMGMWQAAVAHSPLPTILHTAGGEILYLNRAFAAATGFTMADIPDARSWMRRLRRIEPDGSGAAPDGFTSLFGSGDRHTDGLIDVWTAAGERRRWRMTGSEPFSLPDGRLMAVATAQDVTEAERASQELADSRAGIAAQLAQMEALFGAAPVGLQMLDRDLRVVRINDTLAELNGFSVAEHVGRNIFDIVPAVRDVAEPMLRRVLETGEPVIDFEIEGETPKRPGVIRNWNEQFYPVKDEAGDVVGIGVICLETTERTAAERRLEALNRALSDALHRFEVVIRAAQIVVFAQDALRRYTFISEPRWGRSTEGVIGLLDEDVLPPAIAAASIAMKEEVLATGQSRHGDMLVEIEGREIWLHKRVEPVIAADGRVEGLVGVSIDITDRKQRENQVETLMLELAHRSKNLLAVIQGMARHSRGRVSSIDEFLTAFEGRLSSLAHSHDILARGGWSGAGIEDLVSSQIGHYSDLLDGRIACSGPPVTLLPAAAQNLGMALHELSTNAVKYGALSNGEGRVAIGWRIEPGDAEGERFVITWTESGGPQPATGAGTPRGFGRIVTELVAARAVHGEATWTLTPAGLVWQLSAPLSWIAKHSSHE